MREAFIEKNFHRAKMDQIEQIDGIITEYQDDGFVLTVRQLYYQLVARDIIPNTERSYKNTVSLVNNARLSGYLDWDAIEDRTRAFKERARWTSGGQVLNDAAVGYHQDMWAEQDCRVFCINEKEALSGVLSGTCHEYDIPLLSARGYPSSSVLYDFAKQELSGIDQHVVILHLGDHDPSGIDMTRDLIDRLEMFSRQGVTLYRIALTMDQIKEQRPPPNPAKTTDSRHAAYQKRFGSNSWELDALQPRFLNDLVIEHASEYIDFEQWEKTRTTIETIRARIQTTADKFK